MRFLSFSRTLVLTVALGLLMASPASSADVSSRDTAGAEEARFRDDRYDASARPALPAPSSAVSEEAPPASAPDDGQRFRVSSVRLSGNYSIRESELRPFVDPLVGREVTLTEIRGAVDSMKKHYRSKGFIAAYVYVPPQQMTNGMLKIDVLEGRVGELSVTGGSWHPNDRMKGLFRVAPGDVIRYESVRRYVDRVNELGGPKAKAVLAPGTATGTTDVKIEIEDRVPYRLSGTVNNSGTHNTGEYRYGLAASHDNLFGNLDRLDGNVQLGKGVDAYGAGYSVPVSDVHGTRAGYVFSNALVDVGGAFAPLEVEGRARTHRAYLTQPLLEKQDLRVQGTLGVDLKSVENKLLRSVSGKDDLFIPNIDLTVKRTDPAGLTVLQNRFNLGIADFLGSSAENDRSMSRQGTGGDFFTYRGTATRYHKIAEEILLTVRGTLQVSPDALAPSEQISLGGARSVRGYQEGEYLGDHGGYVNVDLYLPANFIPESWRLPWAKQSLRKEVQLIAFADIGTASLRKPLVGEKKNKDLAGAGAGFRVHLYDNFYGRFEWAQAMGDRPFDGRDGKFYFTVSYDFL